MGEYNQYLEAIKKRPELKTYLDVKLTKYIPHIPTPKQEAFLWLDTEEAFFGGAGHSLDTLICTPFGFKKLGSLKINDLITTPSNEKSRIINIVKLGIRKLYEFTFNDGSKIKTTDDHLWKYKEDAIFDIGWRLGTTIDLLMKKSNGSKIQIPVTEPIDFENTKKIALENKIYCAKSRNLYIKDILDKYDYQQGKCKCLVFDDYLQLIKVKDAVNSLGGFVKHNNNNNILSIIEHYQQTPRYIHHIEEVKSEEAWCLQIDHPNGLYLANDYIVTHNCGGGKVLSNDGNILTPKGFKKGKDLKVGDTVNNPDGTLSKITYIYPELEYPEWLVKFHDGTQTTVTGGHLWKAWRSNTWIKKNDKRVHGQNSAQVVETYTLKKWLDQAKSQKEKGKQISWPLIPICEEQEFTSIERATKIDPYLVGLLLGDGCLRKRISLTSGIENKTFFEKIFKKYTYKIYQKNKTTICFILRGNSFLEVKKDLIKLGIYNKLTKDKSVPKELLQGTKEMRYEVLRGLLDTDGTVGKTGRVSFCSISKQLAEDVCFLVRSVGGVASITTKKSFYRDKQGNKVYGNLAYNVYIKHKKSSILFKLPRKAERAKQRAATPMYKRVVDIELTGKPFKGRCISVEHPNGLYITDDFIVTHNSDTLLMAGLQYVDIPAYNGLLIRDTYQNLIKPEGLITRSMEWLTGSDARWIDKQRSWMFPTGATLSFGYLDGPRDEFNYQGAAYQFVGFDECVGLREHQVNFLFSRLRKKTAATYKKELYKLDIYKNLFEGLSKKQIEEHIDYYAKQYENIPLRIRLASNPPLREQVARGEWVKRKYVNPKTRDKSVIFIPSKLDDNPHVDKNSYEKALDKLDPIMKAKMRDGDWDVSEKGEMFQKEWFKFVKQAPFDCEWVRAWDKAGTEPSKTNKEPAWTAGVKMGRDADGKIYIAHVDRFRKTPLGNEKRIRSIAQMDGAETKIFQEQEPGSSGKDSVDHYQRKVLFGFVYKGIASSGSKPERAAPFASAVEAGNVYLVEGDWNQVFLDECEMFPDSKFKDQVDAASLAFRQLTTEKQIRVRII